MDSFQFPTDELRQKWEPVLRWLPQVRTAQAQVLAQTAVLPPTQYLLSIIELESNGNPDNVTYTAHGLMQLTPDAGVPIDWNRILEPQYNVTQGTLALVYKYQECGSNSWDAATIAYFSGQCYDTGKADALRTTQGAYLDHIRQDIYELSAIGVGALTLPNTGDGGTLDTVVCMAKCQGQAIIHNWSSDQLTDCNTDCGFKNVSQRVDDLPGNIVSGIFSNQSVSRVILFLVGAMIFSIGLIRVENG